ncbi:MAG TPA: aminoacyl-tRNA deacylase [Syntrophales bacterium]|jgi:Cys-tRNA(Pro) deacylase|nr:aminoacyl-tRNA deacylase [Syntrophales bacterium]HOD97728.1 aminoacyl-tRNA deacylase [Syntrophales bacterium]HOH72917.1 aminoacyl-tRNA deacylase [Syntrophales bacterium]HPN09964.1 aminoacyl-tRNA deacylase [Syntrophales bacterium]HPX81214.1 aminoacyl-tRNA deacylase [Syntrophales bacterium]
MSKEKFPMTPAMRELKSHEAVFRLLAYKYVDRGGTRISARELGVDEHKVIKTLVMEDENGRPLIVLMHGDRDVSTKSLARILGVKAVSPCDPKVAERHTGYKVGGTSPFGTRKRLPIYIEETILSLPLILINAGHRGILAEMNPAELNRILHPIPVQAAIER